MKTEDLQALDASKDFIPFYESDGHRFYHYVAQNASIPVASHSSDDGSRQEILFGRWPAF